MPKDACHCPNILEEFRSLVRGGIIWVIKDVLLLTDTEPANSCNGIEGCSSFHYLTFDIVGGIVPAERPDTLTEGGACVLPMLGACVIHVTIVPSLHWVVGTASVNFPAVCVIRLGKGLLHPPP